MADIYKYSKEVLREPSPTRFKKSEIQLNDYGDAMKPFPKKVYHGTFLGAAEAILKGNQRGGISFTGKLNDAIYFSFQRAETNEQNGIIFEINTAHIKKSLLTWNDSTGFGGHTFYPKKLPSAAFRVVRHIPYLKIWGKRLNILNSIVEEIKSWKVGAKQGKGDSKETITVKKTQYRDIEKKLKENNWKVREKLRMTGTTKVWEWEKDGQKLSIVRYAGDAQNPKPRIIIRIH